MDAEGSGVSGLKNSMAIPPSQDSPIKPPAFALFAYGFRPFFLAAGAYALLGLIAWLWMYMTGVHPLPSQPAQFWHGHEMLYGFIGAAIAGFLLTAVPSWTGARGFAGTASAGAKRVDGRCDLGALGVLCGSWQT